MRLWGMHAQLQLIAAAKPAGPISGDLWTGRQCNTLTLPLPLYPSTPSLLAHQTHFLAHTFFTAAFDVAERALVNPGPG